MINAWWLCLIVPMSTYLGLLLGAVLRAGEDENKHKGKE